jgi:1-deoxy-D-xylulose-5-phosphate synthase
MVIPVLEGPEHLRSHSLSELPKLTQQIRDKIIQTCQSKGGHIGASLGVVELTVALHYVFESPREAILWDVGHQAYAHKLITGRWNQFETLRCFGGISGFPKREESPHDIFGTGHSSTALSVALAIAWAKGNQQEKPWTVAVVGDGALTAGVSFEALNNVLNTPLGPLLVVLNDNQMSISKNVGAIPKILSGTEIAEFARLFGFDYLGPFDGHDVPRLVEEFKKIKQTRYSKPILFHVKTIKGKGYSPAEEDPAKFHGLGATPKSGSPNGPKKTYSDAFGESLCKFAKADPKIVAITAAMSEGTGLIQFQKEFEKRFFDVGIAEAHAVLFGAGLATQNYRPVIAIYSTFLQRALDSVIHDVALQNLPVVFAVDRAGPVGPDGPTHHGMFDIAYLNAIPNLTLTSPACLQDVGTLLSLAFQSGQPWVIRYPRGGGPDQLPATLENGIRYFQKQDSPQMIVVAYGSVTTKMNAAIEKIDPKKNKITFISSLFFKPFPLNLIRYLNQFPTVPIITIEEGSIRGGFGQTLQASLNQRSGTMEILGYSDHFLEHGTISELEKAEQIDAGSIQQKLKKYLHEEKTS